MASNTGKPNKPLERAAGIGAAMFTVPWVFSAVSRFLDWISKGQTIMSLDPYVHYLLTPWALLIEFSGAVWLLWNATRLEHSREAENAPRIIRPFEEPQKPKKHWFWIKVAVVSLSLSAFAASSTFGLLWYGSHRRNVTAANPPQLVPTQPLAGSSERRTSGGDSEEKQKPTANETPVSKASPPAPSITSQPSATRPANSPPSTPIAPPDEESRVVCPPLGTLSQGWALSDPSSNGTPSSIQSVRPPTVFRVAMPSQPSANPLHPVLRTMPYHDPPPLNQNQSAEAAGLFEELSSYLPKPKPLDTANGPVPMSDVVYAISKSFLQDNNELLLSYGEGPVGGAFIRGFGKKIPINSLSPKAQRVVAEFDALSNSAADNWCKEAMARLSAKPQ